MEKILFILLTVYIVMFIPMTMYLDNIFSKNKNHNIFINIFLIIIAIFGNPLTVVIAFLVAGSFFDGLNTFDKGITTMPRIILFTILAILVSVVRFIIWCDSKHIKATKKSLLLFYKNSAYQAPFLLFTIGFFQYWNGELQVPGISLWVLIVGVLYTFLFSYLKKNTRSL